MRRVTLRPAVDDDAELLFRVYASTREEELAIVPWTPEEKEKFLRQQFHAQQTYYQDVHRNANYDVVLCDGQAAGRFYVNSHSHRIDIVDIALLPEFRGDGIGGELLSQVCADADAEGKTVRIHVEVNNRARRLYQRKGFTAIESRDGVYILMERSSR